MSVTIKSASAIGILLALGACGSSSDPETVSAGSSVTRSGVNPADLNATYDPLLNTITLTDGLAVYVYNLLGSNDTVESFTRDTTIWWDIAFHGETSTGSGSATAFISTEDGYEAAAAVIERDGTTVLPTGGSVTYTGDYMAADYVLVGADPVYNYVITGDMSLAVSFAGDPSVVSGAVTNRFAGGRSYADIILESVTLDGASFSGTVSGGQLLTGGGANTTADGIYSGILTGATAGEAVGTMTFTHNNEVGEQRFEIGVFVAE